MPSSFSGAAGRARLAILLVVAALCVVPALVRATYTPSGASTVRLNRGFSLPPAKSSVARPVQVAIVFAEPMHDDASLGRADHTVRCADETIPDAPPDRSPDALRGPPRTSRT